MPAPRSARPARQRVTTPLRSHHSPGGDPSQRAHRARRWMRRSGRAARAPPSARAPRSRRSGPPAPRRRRDRRPGRPVPRRLRPPVAGTARRAPSPSATWPPIGENRRPRSRARAGQSPPVARRTRCGRAAGRASVGCWVGRGTSGSTPTGAGPGSRTTCAVGCARRSSGSASAAWPRGVTRRRRNSSPSSSRRTTPIRRSPGSCCWLTAGSVIAPRCSTSIGWCARRSSARSSTA